MALITGLHRLALSAVVAISLGAPTAALAGSSPLETLLLAFSQKKGEKQIAALPNIEWHNLSYPNEHERDLRLIYYLPGRLRLDGFGEVDLPVGVGADATSKKGNEGDASVNVVIDSAEGPYRIELQKFYPSSNYQEILQQQLRAGTVTLLADNCKTDGKRNPPDTEFTAFFRIDFAAAPTTIFVRAGRNEEGGKYNPGETFFSFSLAMPGNEITDRSCMMRRTPRK